MSFDYTLEEENSHLIVKTHLKEGGPRRQLYRDLLLKTARGKDLDAVKALIEEHLVQKGRSGADTLAFNRVLIPSKRLFTLLKTLGATGNLYWKGKKLFVDPFARLKLHIEVGDRIYGFVETGSELIDLSSCSALFAGNPPAMIAEGALRFFEEDADWEVLKALVRGSQPLGGELEEDLKALPRVTWKKVEPAQSIPTPFLRLSDKTGAFGDLWFEYESCSAIAAHDDTPLKWRNKEAERSWERDLLETDFTKKLVGTTHYYCPLDKVASSLTFLLEIGWKLYDHQGRQILKQEADALELAEQDGALIVKGRVAYGEHSTELSNVLGSFNRREQFVELSPTSVGLLAPKPYWEELTGGGEIVADGVSLPRHRVALIEEIFPSAAVVRAMQTPPYTPPEGSFLGDLYPYQQEGLNWLSLLREHGFHGLLADQMGLGKTVQAIAFLSRLTLTEPVLIVAPTTLLFNWRKELEKFLPVLPIYVHTGKGRAREVEELAGKRIILTSYALLRLDSALLEQIGYECVILDEAQAIKNASSQIAHAACRLTAKMRLAITGTPLENSPRDLFSLFHFLMPGLLGEEAEFSARLNAGVSDSRHIKALQKTLRPFILRRTKEVLADQLPSKIEQTLYIEMGEEQRAYYEEWLAKARSGLLKKVSLDGATAHRLEVLELILRLRQICCHPAVVGGEVPSAKLERLLEELEPLLLENRKVLIYSQFTSVLQLIASAFRERGWAFAYLDGSTERREEVVSAFQEDPGLNLFLISLKAGGVGLNLTAADYVFLFDPWWNAAAEEQAIDRAHRLGRAGTVIARRFVAADTIEEKMMKLKEHKLALAQGILNFEDVIKAFDFEDIIKSLFL